MVRQRKGFISNAKGNKKAVILAIEPYQEMLERPNGIFFMSSGTGSRVWGEPRPRRSRKL